MTQPLIFALLGSDPAGAPPAGPGLVGENGQVVLTQLVAQSSIAASGSSALVYKPGGVAGGNVFTTMGSALAAAAALNGAVTTLYVNVSLGAAVVSAADGAVSFKNVILVGDRMSSDGVVPTLTFQTGATIVPGGLWLDAEGLLITSTSTAAVYQLANHDIVEVGIECLMQSGAVPFFNLPGPGNSAQGFLHGIAALWGDGVNPVVSIAAGSTFGLQAQFGTTLNNNFATGLGTFSVNADVGANISVNQPGGLTTYTVAFTGGAHIETPNAISTFAAAGFAPGAGTLLLVADILTAKTGRLTVSGTLVISTTIVDQCIWAAFFVDGLTAVTGGTIISGSEPSGPAIVAKPVSTTPPFAGGVAIAAGQLTTPAAGLTVVVPFSGLSVLAVRGHRIGVAIQVAQVAASTWTVTGTLSVKEDT